MTMYFIRPALQNLFRKTSHSSLSPGAEFLDDNFQQTHFHARHEPPPTSSRLLHLILNPNRKSTEKRPTSDRPHKQPHSIILKPVREYKFESEAAGSRFWKVRVYIFAGGTRKRGSVCWGLKRKSASINVQVAYWSCCTERWVFCRIAFGLIFTE